VPYQGITPISGGSLSACAETYFAQSEQLPTRFATSFGLSSKPGGRETWRGGGVMVQHMPKASPFASGGGSGEDGLLLASDIVSGDDAENWNRVNLLLDTVEEIELVGPSGASDRSSGAALSRGGAAGLRPQPVDFGCTCSEDRVRRSLSIYSAKDIAQMTTDEGIVTADCQFCGAHYELDPEDAGLRGGGPAGCGRLTCARG
jgi:molecular chaperone Hsp33